MQSSSSNKHSKKRSTSSLSYRSAQNASYRQLDDGRRKKWHSAEESQSGGHSGSRTKSAVPNNRYDTRNSRSPKRKKNRGCLGRILLPLILLILIIFALFFLFLRSAFNKVEKYELNMSDIVVNDKDDNMNNYQTIALFGVDNQDNKIKDVGSRTDTIIIVSINKSSKDVKLMSIYRDTYVSIDGEYDKINAAYAYGGPEQAINTINRNLDLNITDFATVNFKALADAVDILGGIELTIKSEKELENLNDYIGNMNKINGGDSPKFDEVGTYTFDGNQAVAYSRIRYMEGGDHERANHQRLVVEGIVKKVKQQPWKLKALAFHFFAVVEQDPLFQRKLPGAVVDVLITFHQMGLGVLVHIVAEQGVISQQVHIGTRSGIVVIGMDRRRFAQGGDHDAVPIVCTRAGVGGSVPWEQPANRPTSKVSVSKMPRECLNFHFISFTSKN